MTPEEIANPQLVKKIEDNVEEVFPVPATGIVLTGSEKAWAGLIIGTVGTAILIIAGFIDDPKIQAMLYAIGALVNTVGVRLGVFQVANS